LSDNLRFLFILEPYGDCLGSHGVLLPTTAT
jgi:hypothetical protein